MQNTFKRRLGLAERTWFLLALIVHAGAPGAAGADGRGASQRNDSGDSRGRAAADLADRGDDIPVRELRQLRLLPGRGPSAGNGRGTEGFLRNVSKHARSHSFC